MYVKITGPRENGIAERVCVAENIVVVDMRRVDHDIGCVVTNPGKTLEFLDAADDRPVFEGTIISRDGTRQGVKLGEYHEMVIYRDDGEEIEKVEDPLLIIRRRQQG